MADVDEVLEDLSELQRCILLLVYANNKEPIRGHTWFQKELFLVARNVKEIDEEASFASDMYGPYSENAKEELEVLELDRLIEKDGNRISLSKFGLLVAEKIVQKTSSSLLEIISEFKSLLNDLSDDEVLTFVYFSFPKFTEESLVLDKVMKNRKIMALKLYHKEKVSLQRAAEIAGEPLEKFLKEVEI